MPLGKKDWNWMGHISFWLMLMIWIYWVITDIIKKKHRNFNWC
jgi:hypothetical protein